MIYYIIRRIIKISLSVFFKKIVVTGRENIPDHGPMIIASNHPNTFMDPLIISSIITERIGFVSNAGIFTNKLLISIFRYFHVIPIFRKKDVAPGETPDNKKAFVKCHEYLMEGRTFLIFPEGSSYYELKLREIKTGTARIALSFEKTDNAADNLKILPVALDYSDSLQFRSMVCVTVNPPIDASDYRDIYLRNQSDGVKQLTEDIRKALAKNIPQTSGKEQEEYLIKAHKFYTAYYEPGADLYENPKRSLELRKQLANALNYVRVYNATLYLETQKKIFEYFIDLKSAGLTTGFLTDEFFQKNKIIVCLNYIMKFIFLLPFYIAGLITNYIPYILPSKIFYLLKIDIEYKTPVEMVSGLITFPVYYALSIWLFSNYINNAFWLTLFLLVLFPVCGYIAMYYWTTLQRFARIIRFYFFTSKDQKIKLIKFRNEILGKIEEARKSLVVK
jgi:1-acyl-sn-glycerol-3-phosphate acyltransferase